MFSPLFPMELTTETFYGTQCGIRFSLNRQAFLNSLNSSSSDTDIEIKIQIILISYM